MDNRPVGICDSGLGGLTCLKEFARLLPGEEIVFFGDTARVPYGGRDPETLRRFADEDIALLLSKGVKAVLIACGTISSNCPDLPETAEGAPVLRLVRPCAEAALRATKNNSIAIIATQATISSGAIARELTRLSPECRVASVACPGLVPAIEDGHISPGDPVISDMLREYLAPVLAAGADTLVLGCTHYPLLAPAISELLGGEVTLIDAGAELARSAAALLGAKARHGGGENAGRKRFYVSGNAASFAKNAAIFIGEDISGQVSVATAARQETATV